VTQPIAILGAGRMGAALATVLAQKGYPPVLWNRTRSRAEALVARGVRGLQVADTPRDAIERAAVVFVIVSDYAATEALLHTPDVCAALRGKLLVQVTSGTPAQARGLARWAREHHVAYLDGAIMAPPDLVGTSDCLILYAGDRQAFDTHRELLGALAGHTVYVSDDPGHAGALDSALLAYFWGALFGTLLGTAAGQAEGIPLETYRGHLRALLPVVSASVIELSERAEHGRFGNTPATIETHRAALEHLSAICEQHAIDRRLPDVFGALMRKAIARGHGQDDFAAILNAMR
jgi:3-hydroxyisobutyrate dehydrogenase-like beta-hydroxyacid dehydrogenase